MICPILRYATPTYLEFQKFAARLAQGALDATISRRPDLELDAQEKQEILRRQEQHLKNELASIDSQNTLTGNNRKSHKSKLKTIKKAGYLKTEESLTSEWQRLNDENLVIPMAAANRVDGTGVSYLYRDVLCSAREEDVAQAHSTPRKSFILFAT